MTRLHICNLYELSVTQSAGAKYCLAYPPIKPQSRSVVNELDLNYGKCNKGLSRDVLFY